MSEQGIIYKIKQGDSVRKALDLEGLKYFIEKKKLEFNLLNLNPEAMKDLDMNTMIAKAAVSTLLEIESICDNALGLNKVEEKPSEEISEEVSEPENVLPEEKFDEPVETPPVMEEPPVQEPPQVPPEHQEAAEQAAESEEPGPEMLVL